MDLYSENILDHYKNPRNKGKLKGANASSKDANPLCGDKVFFYLKLDKNGLIKDARFDGNGCAISQASASMLAEILPGKKSSDVMKWDRQKVFDLLKVELTPARTKCALLSLHVLHEALKDAQNIGPKTARSATLNVTDKDVRTFNEKNPFYKILNKIIDPDTQIGIADMGLIYGAKKKGAQIRVTMTLTSMGCPAGPHFIEEIEYYLKKQKNVKEVLIEIVWEPPWTPDRIKPELRAVLGI
jgi:nitrogen fixation protein NifU and related proteins